MAGPYDIPAYAAATVAARLAAGDRLVLLDVREPYELELARIAGDVVNVPLSELVAHREAALPAVLADRRAEIVVLCHHGVRSAQVTSWLRQLGYLRAYNLEGGIDAWAREVEPSVGFY